IESTCTVAESPSLSPTYLIVSVRILWFGGHKLVGEFCTCPGPQATKGDVPLSATAAAAIAPVATSTAVASAPMRVRIGAPSLDTRERGASAYDPSTGRREGLPAMSHHKR